MLTTCWAAQLSCVALAYDTANTANTWTVSIAAQKANGHVAQVRVSTPGATSPQPSGGGATGGGASGGEGGGGGVAGGAQLLKVASTAASDARPTLTPPLQSPPDVALHSLYTEALPPTGLS